MLQEIGKDDPLSAVAECLLKAVYERETQGESFTVIQNGAACEDVIEGLSSRLRAKGPERGMTLGLLQTVDLLRSSGGLVNIILIDTPKQTGIIYSDLANSRIIGLTISSENEQ